MPTDLDAHRMLKRNHSGSVAGDFTLPGADKHYPPDLALEPIHLDIVLDVDVDARRAVGAVTHTVRARTGGPRSITLHAEHFEKLEVSALEGHELTWRYDGSQLHITWQHGFRSNETRKVLVRYTVTDPIDGLNFSQPSATRPNAPRYAYTDHETERARYWLPTIDLPSVRPHLDFHLRADEDFVILANGALINEEHHGDGTKTAHWKLAHPCPSYITSFVLGELVRHDDEPVDGIAIASFAPAPYTTDHLARSFHDTGNMLRWINDKLGLSYPYPKYYQYAVPNIGGAMENISLVSWDAMYLLDAQLGAELGGIFDRINLHEMAHSWFGDLIVCRDFSHAWLKESWATYMELCWLEDCRGEDEARYEYWLKAQAYFDEADTRYKRPIVTREFNSSWQMYDRHLYPGGACRLHTLRHTLGEESFWRAVQDYVRRYANDVVETEDFRRVLEQHSGRSLGRFFDQWFYAPGYPHLKVDFEWQAEEGHGSFTITQTQHGQDDGVPLFALELELGWVIDGQLETVTTHFDEARHVVRAPMPCEPEQIRVDPHAKLLHKLEFEPGQKQLIRQLFEAPDVIGRIQAGRVLARSGRNQAIQAVLDAYRKEAFWGVRCELAKSLGSAVHQLATDGLVALIAEEQEARVLPTLLQAAGSTRASTLPDAILNRLEQSLNPRAAEAAWEVLGTFRQNAPFEQLVTAAQTTAYNDYAQSGALRGLAATRRIEAIAVLIKATEPGPGADRPRAVAAKALGSLAPFMERRERETIVDHLLCLLQDSSGLVHRAAAEGLGAAGDQRAIAALEVYSQRVATQNAVAVKGHIQALRATSAQRKGAKPWHDELEELRNTVAKLRAQIGVLEAHTSIAESTSNAEPSDAV